MKKRENGFSLVKLMVAIVIIVILFSPVYV